MCNANLWSDIGFKSDKQSASPQPSPWERENGYYTVVY